MKINKKLDRSQKVKIHWMLGYREMAYHLVTLGNKKVWEDLVALSDKIRQPKGIAMITDALKWALAKEKNELSIDH